MGRSYRHGRYPSPPRCGQCRSRPTGPLGSCPDPGVVVLPIVAVHGAHVPWGKVVVEGVPVVTARHLPSMLRQLPAVR
jgi:hypothetical protein